ncbi:MAG: type I 3-dehydroquinate dehydratase [Gammaproteobacteria bacterium]|nr:type I 3-dehydroquinate dehydratase [Gammaproteobacteria bacterium]
MIIATIPILDFLSTKNLIERVRSEVDGFEFRLDYLKEFNLTLIKDLMHFAKRPIIFTLRKKTETAVASARGYEVFSRGDPVFKSMDTPDPASTAGLRGLAMTRCHEELRLNIIEQLCALKPDYFDIEHDVSIEFVQNCQRKFSTIRWIRSYHNYLETPKNLKGILESMQHACFSYYKMAMQARSTVDALRILQFGQKNALTAIAMGEFGQCTRILSRVIENDFHFVSVNERIATAAGQLSVEELKNCYHFHQHNENTRIYALLGDPVENSLGHVIHNQYIRENHLNAVYIKLKIRAHELAEAFLMMQTLPFSGFSVTMPLKEVIVPLLDEMDEEAKNMGAVNTVLKMKNGFKGFNTDGEGAMCAIKKYLPQLPRKMMVLGSGGAARAIIHAAKKEGMEIVIFNRTLERANQLAEHVKGRAYSLDELQQFNKISDAILVNTLPNGVIHFEPQNFSNEIPVMDCVYLPKETYFLAAARKAGCVCIPGEEMFLEQAKLQQRKWFSVLNDSIG